MNKYKEYFKVTKEAVFGFFEGFRFLSNFPACEVYFDGLKFGSSEAAYQAAKTLDLEIRQKFTTLDAKEAKKLGYKLELRPDWNKVKFEIMQAIVFDKFYRNKDLRKQLIATKDLYLEETNHWNDTYWGVQYDSKEGENRLGEILMVTRCLFQYCPAQTPVSKQIHN